MKLLGKAFFALDYKEPVLVLAVRRTRTYSRLTSLNRPSASGCRAKEDR